MAGHLSIPADYEVRPIPASTPGASVCGTCGLAWDDEVVTSMTPAPAARCPFEAFHRDPDVWRFEIYPHGDMCSRAWDATAYVRFGDRYGTYQGDVSGMYGKRRLVQELRRRFPGCRIRVRK